MAYDFATSLKQIDLSEIIKLKTDLVHLFDWEVIAKGQYFQELRKFDGEIFETIKWLYEQEQWHSSALEQILGRANILVKEKPLKPQNLGTDVNKIIGIDVMFEEKTVIEYKRVLDKTNGPLKEILKNLMEEELHHVEVLKQFLKTGE